MTAEKRSGMRTTIFPVDIESLGTLRIQDHPDDLLDELEFQLSHETDAAAHIWRAVKQLQTSDVPVAFPTETVYGLGADATRSDAVKGIFVAKQRPSDNPLIVHFASLQQLRAFLEPSTSYESLPNGTHGSVDPIPAIYRPLIRKFWPGPLTIILPVPHNEKLAPEVTAGLDTFGARIPRHPIAIALISLAGVPIAAPSANASTKPSPTAAEHVATDLEGKIETIIDGGPCEVGVESTVVDGLTVPPVVLRPGGISIEQLRACPGWEAVTTAYGNADEKRLQPRAPGMKYRHYSPRAPVFLYENGSSPPDWSVLWQHRSPSGSVGVLRTRNWFINVDNPFDLIEVVARPHSTSDGDRSAPSEDDSTFAAMLKISESHAQQLTAKPIIYDNNGEQMTVYDIELGRHVKDIARGVFAALRKLDQQAVGAIFVEGIIDSTDDLAAAIMNRLRKAAGTAT